MNAKKALSILNVSRTTLMNYVNDGRIKATKLFNGRYEYDDDSVYALLNHDLPRKVCLYARVSTQKQKVDLDNQVSLLKNFCFQNGICINAIYTDIASGIDFEKRKSFFTMLDEILDKKVKTVIITYKDRLSRVGFNMFKHLFEHFGCEIIVMSEIGSTKLDSEEIFEEIVSLLHCYSMKLYSKRRVNKIKEVLNDKDYD